MVKKAGYDDARDRSDAVGAAEAEDDFSDVLLPFGGTADAGAAFKASEARTRLRGAWARANFVATLLVFAVSGVAFVLFGQELEPADYALAGAWALLKIAGAGFVRALASASGFKAPALLAVGSLVPGIDAFVFWRVYCAGARQSARALEAADGNRMNFRDTRGHAILTFGVGAAAVLVYAALIAAAMVAAALAGGENDAWETLGQATIFLHLVPVLLYAALGIGAEWIGPVGPLIVMVGYFAAVGFLALRIALIWRLGAAARYLDDEARFGGEPLATPEERVEARRRRAELADDGRPAVSSYLAAGFRRGGDGLPILPGGRGLDDDGPRPDADDAARADAAATENSDAVPRRPRLPDWRRD